jgi:hypothetical protein
MEHRGSIGYGYKPQRGGISQPGAQEGAEEEAFSLSKMADGFLGLRI